MLIFDSRCCDRVLSDNTAIVFDFNVQLIVWQNAFAELQDFRESIGTEPVLRVATDMCLEQYLFFCAGFATAIDKLPYHVTNFGYVSVSGNHTAIGQHETEKYPGMLA
jgi:hypothetical protein